MVAWTELSGSFQPLKRRFEGTKEFAQESNRRLRLVTLRGILIVGLTWGVHCTYSLRRSEARAAPHQIRVDRGSSSMYLYKIHTCGCTVQYIEVFNCRHQNLLCLVWITPG